MSLCPWAVVFDEVVLSTVFFATSNTAGMSTYLRVRIVLYQRAPSQVTHKALVHTFQVP